MRRGAHNVSDLHVHLVFVTWRRQPSLTAPLLVEMRRVMIAVAWEVDAELIEFNGEKDHVHLLLTYAPKVRLSDLVQRLKGVTSRRLSTAWSASYYAGSVGQDLTTVRAYIESQERPE